MGLFGLIWNAQPFDVDFRFPEHVFVDLAPDFDLGVGTYLTSGKNVVVDFNSDRSGLVGEGVFVFADLGRDFSGEQDVLVVNGAFEDFVDGGRRDAGRADVLGAGSRGYRQHSDGKACGEKACDQFFRHHVKLLFLFVFQMKMQIGVVLFSERAG